MTKIAVLVSGGGTNLQALIDAQQAGKIENGQISLVVSSNPKAYALERAAKAAIPSEVLRRKDYTDGSVIDCRTGEKTAMELSGSNVLRYELADGTAILVRPSGTEPKIKVYILTIGKDEAERDENLAKYSQWVATLTK